MGELRVPDPEDSSKKKEHTEEVFRTTSYDSFDVRSMTSVNEKSMPEEEPANAEEEVLETKNEKEVEKNNKHEKQLNKMEQSLKDLISRGKDPNDPNEN